MSPLAILIAFTIVLTTADGALAKKRHRHHEPSSANKNKQINTSTPSREKVAVSSPEVRVDPTAPVIPKMVRTIGIKPETWPDRWVELRTLRVPTAVFAELVEDVAATAAHAATNNWSGTKQATFAISLPDEVNATATAEVATGTLGPASPSSTSFDIYDVAATIGGALVVFCGFRLWHYVIRAKQRYGAIPIDPCMMPIDLASRRIAQTSLEPSMLARSVSRATSPG
jgi:hypothetical protein